MKFIKQKKAIALFFFTILMVEITMPSVAYALTGGPSQPEFQNFTPVQATEMVNLFTGDFQYNIPLMDVDGYPINIAYNNVGSVDDEASWTGLGWNINLGEIQHNVKGVPDDFKGDLIKKHMFVKPENDVCATIGYNFEICGIKINKAIKKLAAAFKKKVGKAGVNLMMGHNNYTGTYLGVGASVRPVDFSISPAINLNFSSNNGFTIKPELSYVHKLGRNGLLNYGVGLSTGFNTRVGFSELHLSGSINSSQLLKEGKDLEEKTVEAIKNANCEDETKLKDQLEALADKRRGLNLIRGSIRNNVSNFLPVITNPVRTTAGNISFAYGLKGPLFMHVNVNASITASTHRTQENISKKAYGVQYIGNAAPQDLTDFTRDNGGAVSKYIPRLPVASLDYDMYNVQAQGAGGSFKVLRNDIGVVSDSRYALFPSGGNIGLGATFAPGAALHLGIDVNLTLTEQEQGKLEQEFMDKRLKLGVPLQGFNEDNQSRVAFNKPYSYKALGEMTSNSDDYYNSVSRDNTGYITNLNTRRDVQAREPRGEHLYSYTTDEANEKGYTYLDTIKTYQVNSGILLNTTGTTISKSANGRAGHHVSEMVKTNSNGQKYIFGIPALNNITREMNCASGASGFSTTTGLQYIPSNFETDNNGQGRSELYSYTMTPTYAHSYLLSAILSPDYVDTRQDGFSDDDLGNYVKFNYSRVDLDYRWRIPYSTGGIDSGFYNAGYETDNLDQTVRYTIGSKELWYAHSIVTKNMIAEFYITPRLDAKGTGNGIKDAGGYATGAYANPITPGNTFKLDKIVLYNKQDRLQNGALATPVKEVSFEYDYELCPNTPNSTAPNKGKLTLKKIFTKYGKSNKNLFSPYQFTYSNFNPGYNPSTKNRWGTYKPMDPVLPNYEFPYLNPEQSRDSTNKYVTAWQLTQVQLPTGGTIKVNYEADDYAYVQDQRASEMYRLVGINATKNLGGANNLLYDGKTKKNDDEYINKYLIIKKKPGAVMSDLRKAYLDNRSAVYYNMAINLSDIKAAVGKPYEQIRNYAEINDIGECSDNSSYFWLELKPKKLVHGKQILNPITYTALNFARRELSGFIYPGSSADFKGGKQALAGLGYSFKEMFNMFGGVNPVKTLVNRGLGKEVNLAKSFIRLYDPCLKKPSGGIRVKRIELSDQWQNMVAEEDNATFGSTYDYTVLEGNARVSSGVAQYEPGVGGEENSCKTINNYKSAKGSSVPRNEPIYNESLSPLGEDYFPAPIIGYSKVTVKSIHEPYARSAQASAEYGFYTAKDFPVYSESSTMVDKGYNVPLLVRNEVAEYRAQSHVIVLNDMHGKPKYVKNLAQKSPGDINTAIIDEQLYTYRTETNNGHRLNNEVPTIKYSEKDGIQFGQMTLGVDADITLDSRFSRTRTYTGSLDFNTDVELFGFGFFPIPWFEVNINKFGSYTQTKLIQKYGILQSITAKQNGAAVTTTNEYFDANTGKPIVTSSNNEYGELEYKYATPAYWMYKELSSPEQNIFYTGRFTSIQLTNGVGKVVSPSKEQVLALCDGDELMIKVGTGNVKAWVSKSNGAMCDISLYTKGDSSTNFWLTSSNTINGAEFTVMKSGRKNILDATTFNVLSPDKPTNLANLLDPNRVIDVGATVYKNDNCLKPLAGTPQAHPSLNPFLYGYQRVISPYASYIYKTNRDYSNSNARNTGFYNPKPFWTFTSAFCGNPEVPNHGTFTLPTWYSNSGVPEWQVSKQVSYFNPYGGEQISYDLLGIGSAAQYGFNNRLPIAVANNVSNYSDFFADGFEDYNYLCMPHLLTTDQSPFKKMFTTPSAYNSSAYKKLVPNGGFNLVDSVAHTGVYALRASSSATMNLNISSATQHLTNTAELAANKPYLFSSWVRTTSTNANPFVIVSNGISYACKATTQNIDGWVKYEVAFTTGASGSVDIMFMAGFVHDDVRCYPDQANMMSYVYNAQHGRLMAQLDENNFATFYEYEIDGSLLRIKKETEKGILTIKENRSSNKKN